MKREFYQTEIRECFDKPYVKVFVNNLSLLEPVQSLLLTLLSVGKVNISDSNSKNSLSKNLTVYPKNAFSAQEVEDEVRQVLDNYFFEPDSKNVAETRHFLSEHTKALEVYDSAIQKILKGEYDRNAIDDLRLAWDLLIGDLTGIHDASPNKQKEAIGKLLEEKGVVKEMRNMFVQVVDLYAKYQDKNIKHDNNLTHDDVLLVLNITNAFIKRIISDN